MNQLLFYMLQVIAASGLLYGYYHFALRNKKFHRYNRFYLLMAVAISSLIPFLNIPVYFSDKETESSVVLQTLQVISSPVSEEPPQTVAYTQTAASSPGLTIENMVYLFYLLVILFFVVKILLSLNKIKTIIKRNTVERIDKIKFINTDEPGTPFSFFRWLFWNKKIELNSEKGEQIFRHELFHIQQKHSWDVIFMEIVSTIFWINPFFHLIKKELKAIHEFLADEFAIKENKNWQYAELLLMQVLNTNAQLVNPFFHNQIKRRIAMITTSKKASYQYIRKLMVLPVAAIIFFLFAFTYKNKKGNDREFENAINSITVVIDAGHGGTDNGAKSPDGKYYESKLCLQIAQKIEELGKDYNVNVILTRSDDAFPGEAKTKTDALKKRREIARKFNPDIFVSIHLNSEGPNKSFQTKSSGFEAYISDEKPSERNISLAKIILTELKSVYTTDLGVRQREGQGVYVLDENIVPAMLLECGYINNPNDIAFITKESNQEEVAKAILKGLVTFANNKTKDNRSGFQKIISDTSKLIQNALVVINGVVQEKRGLYNIDTTKLTNKEFKGTINAFWGKEALDKYGERGKEGVIEFFFDQNGNEIIDTVDKYGEKGNVKVVEVSLYDRNGDQTADTIPKVDTVYWIKDIPPPAKQSPTSAQLKSWQDSKMYGVWLDGKRISNNEMTKYKPSDFGYYFVSKLSKNAVNYGKHYVQVDLFTHSYYEKVYSSDKKLSFLIKSLVDSNITRAAPLLVVNGKPMPGLKMESLKKVIPEGSLITQTNLNKEAALKKYGEYGRNGAVELRSQNSVPIIEGYPTIEEVILDKLMMQEDESKVYEKVDVEAVFPGGHSEWRSFLTRNLNSKVPVSKGAKPGTYTVVVQFIVNKNGAISDVRALTNHGFGMEEEAIRVISKGPNWIPATYKGKIVKAYRRQPVTYVIAKTTTNIGNIPLNKVRGIEQEKTNSKQILALFGQPGSRSFDNNSIYWVYEANNARLSIQYKRSSEVVSDFLFSSIINPKRENIEYEKAKSIKENQTTLVDLQKLFGMPYQVDIKNNDESWTYEGSNSRLIVSANNRKNGIINLLRYQE